MSERLTDEELDAIAEDNRMRTGDAYLTAAECRMITTELRSLRASAVTLTSEDKEVLRHARDFVAADLCGEDECQASQCQRNQRALAVLTRLIDEGKP